MSIRISKPFSAEFPITQKFGAIYTYKGKPAKHKGVDWGTPFRTPILACASGIVKRVKVKYTPFDYGREIIIDHGSYNSQYAHLNEILPKEGDKVFVGELIAYSGKSGFCLGRTGYHLHFGIFDGISFVDPIPLIVDTKIEAIQEHKIPTLKFLNNIQRKTLARAYVYTVKPGDTLVRIAKDFYKEGGYWHNIFLANQTKLESPDKIFPGQKLILPDLQ